MRAKRKESPALGFKDTYWNKLRVERGFKLKEIAEVLDMHVGTIGAFFTGQAMPNDKAVADMCDLFGVGFLEGRRQFENAHKAWDAEHKRVYRLPAVKSQGITAEVKVDESRIEEVLAVAEEFNKKVAGKTEEPELAVVSDNIFEMVYDVLDYDEFNEFFNAVAGQSGDPLRLIFHKVDFKTYRKIAEIIKGD